MRIRHLFIYVTLFCCFLCGATNATAQARRALLVGISDYGVAKNTATGEQWTAIHGSNDVQLLTGTLKRQGFSVTTVCDKRATASNVRSALSKLVSACHKRDVVYLHFSCHGQPFEDLNGDEEDGWDESLIPYDAPMLYNRGRYEGKNHILDDELHVYFQKIRQAIGKNGLLYVTIDACHAGGSSRGDELDEEDEPVCRGTKRAFSPSGKIYRPRVNTNGHFTIPAGNNLGDIVIMEACRSYQSNYEIKQDGKFYGPLSFYVNQALQSGRFSRDLNLVNDVKRRMDADRRLTRQNMVYETSLK